MAAPDKQIKVDIVGDALQFQKTIVGVTQRINKMEEETRRRTSMMETSFNRLGATAATVLTGGAILYYSNQVRQIADEYQNLGARLKLVTDGSGDLTIVQKRLYEISQDTGTQYSANAGSYAKLAVSIKDLGGNSEETLKITEIVNKSLIVNGSSTASAAAFMEQFAQAMGSGVLSGDEFKSMLENNTFFASKLAKALNTDISGLRKMANEQELTTAKLRAAFPQMAEEINAAFSKIPPTTARAITALENAFFKIIDDSNKASDGTGTIATSILELAQTIDTNREGIISLFTSIISVAARTTQALGNIGQSMAGWEAVGEGRLSFLKFATMDAKELNAWLKQGATEIGKIDGKITQLRDKQRQIASEGFYTKEGIQAKKEALAAVAAQISALEKEKAALAGLATTSKATRDAMAENDARHYGKTTAAAQKSAEEQKKATEKALAAMQKKYQGYADEVKRLQESIAGREQSLTEKLRAMGRSAMTDKGAWIDRKNEAEEFIAAAKKAKAASDAAFAAGNETLGQSKAAEAVQLYDKASSAAEDLNREIKRGDTVIRTQQQNLGVAAGLMKQAQAGAIAVEKSLIAANTEAAKILNINSGLRLSQELPEAAKVFGLMKTQVEEVNQEIEKIGETYTNISATATEESGKSAGAQKEHVQDVGKEVLVLGDVWTNVYDDATEAAARATGKMLSDIEKVKKAAASIKISSASGGTDGYARGGDPFFGGLRGYGGGDRRLILVEDGEHVVRKEATAALGHGFFQRYNNLNFLRSLPRFATGGPIGTAPAVSMAAGATYNQSVTVNVSGTGGQSSAREIAKTVLTELQKMHRGRS